jgi:hypothetical protein
MADLVIAVLGMAPRDLCIGKALLSEITPGND